MTIPVPVAIWKLITISSLNRTVGAKVRCYHTAFRNGYGITLIDAEVHVCVHLVSRVPGR